MFTAKNMTKRTDGYTRKYQKFIMKEIKKNIHNAASSGYSWIFVNKNNSDIDENMTNNIVAYFTKRGFKVDNHEGYSYIDISWGE